MAFQAAVMRLLPAVPPSRSSAIDQRLSPRWTRYVSVLPDGLAPVVEVDEGVAGSVTVLSLLLCGNGRKGSRAGCSASTGTRGIARGMLANVDAVGIAA